MHLAHFLAGLLSFASVGLVSAGCHKEFNFPNQLTIQSVEAPYFTNSTTLQYGLDAPFLVPRPNATSFNIWHFDAVNPANPKEAITVIFYLASKESFPPNDQTEDAMSVEVILNLADGKKVPIFLEARDAGHGGVFTFEVGCGKSLVSNWETCFSKFEFSPATGWVITLDAAYIGLSGRVTLNPIQHERLPCSIQTTHPDQTLNAARDLGWTNSVPDAKASVDISLNSRTKNIRLNFNEGVGYHDVMYSHGRFRARVKYMHWGHARLRNYSLVWLMSENHQGERMVRKYVSPIKDHIDEAKPFISCQGSLTTSPDEVAFEMDGGSSVYSSSKAILKFQDKQVVRDVKGLKQWIGKVSGHIYDEQIEGVVSFFEYHAE